MTLQIKKKKNIELTKIVHSKTNLKLLISRRYYITKPPQKGVDDGQGSTWLWVRLETFLDRDTPGNDDSQNNDP